MSTSKDDIRRWLKEAKQRGATHMLVVVDTFDHEDYPVDVLPSQDPETVYKSYNGKEMQRVMEAYNLSLDLESQLNEHRSHHLEKEKEEHKLDKVIRTMG